METTERITEEALASYYAAYSDPFVLHLRKALDGYLDGTNEGMDNPNFTVNSHLPGRPSGLDAFKDYFKSKFVVVWLEDNPIGGKIVTVLFRDHPDTLIDAWVYRLSGGQYDLRGFWKADIDKEGLKEWTKRHRGLVFEDQEHVL